MSNRDIDIHMSELDEETKRILAEVEADVESGSNDSKDIIKKDKKVKEVITEKDGYQEYEVNEEKETDDLDW